MPLLCWTRFFWKRGAYIVISRDPVNIKRSCSFSPNSKLHRDALAFCRTIPTEEHISRHQEKLFVFPNIKAASQYLLLCWMIGVCESITQTIWTCSNMIHTRFVAVSFARNTKLYQILVSAVNDVRKQQQNSFFISFAIYPSHNFISFLIQFFAKKHKLYQIFLLKWKDIYIFLSFAITLLIILFLFLFNFLQFFAKNINTKNCFKF